MLECLRPCIAADEEEDGSKTGVTTFEREWEKESGGQREARASRFY